MPRGGLGTSGREFISEETDGLGREAHTSENGDYRYDDDDGDQRALRELSGSRVAPGRPRGVVHLATSIGRAVAVVRGEGVVRGQREVGV